MDSLVYIYQKTQFHKLTVCIYIYSCLSVYRHNVSPHFHHHCLFQLYRLSSCLFVSILRHTIVYGDNKVYRNNVKMVRFLEKLRSTSMMHFTP